MNLQQKSNKKYITVFSVHFGIGFPSLTQLKCVEDTSSFRRRVLDDQERLRPLLRADVARVSRVYQVSQVDEGTMAASPD